jgi:hypothetical protein
MSDPQNWSLAGVMNRVPEVTIAFWVIKIMSYGDSAFNSLLQPSSPENYQFSALSP